MVQKQRSFFILLCRTKSGHPVLKGETDSLLIYHLPAAGGGRKAFPYRRVNRIDTSFVLLSIYRARLPCLYGLPFVTFQDHCTGFSCTMFQTSRIGSHGEIGAVLSVDQPTIQNMNVECAILPFAPSICCCRTLTNQPKHSPADHDNKKRFHSIP